MRTLRPSGMLPSTAAPSPRGTRTTRWLLPTAALLVFAGILVLSACGTSGATSGIVLNTPTVSAGGTATPGVQAYAYLFSRVDYPLQIPVNSGDVVTLTLSPRSNILTVTPAPGQGTTTVGGPIPLPTDVRDYQDIGAAVDTQSASSGATSPIVWQLTSAPRQSLLTPAATGATHGYLDSVVFTWHVQAVAAGQNLIQITLHLYYVYLDGSEHDGSISMTQTPIPMVAADATPLNTTLPPFRIPVAGLTWLAGIVAAIRFIWAVFHTVHDIADPVKDMAEAAKTIHARIASPAEQSDSKSQHPIYPNPWTQAPNFPAGYPAHPQPPAVPGAPGAPGAPQAPSQPPFPASGRQPAPGQPSPNSQRLWPPGP
jgi:hypothetical protein